MSLGIMIAGLLGAVLGTSFAILMGLDLASALVAYGFFGIFGGSLACLSRMPNLRSLLRHGGSDHRTTG